jgi:hypothetical protein
MDTSLSKIQKKAGGDAGKVLRSVSISFHAFRFGNSCRFRSEFTHVLRKDQELHGVVDYTVQDDTLDDFQYEVDGIVDASILDATTSSGASCSGPILSSATVWLLWHQQVMWRIECIIDVS